MRFPLSDGFSLCQADIKPASTVGLGSPKARRKKTRVREGYPTEEERPGHHDVAVEGPKVGGSER